MKNDLDKFKNELLLALDNCIAQEELKKFSTIFDSIAARYEITHKCTDVTIYNNNELPNEVKMFFVSKKIEGIAKSSLNRYKLVYEHFFRMFNKNVNEITANDIRLFLYNYQETRGCSNRTIDSMRSCLMSLFSWLNVEGYIDKNPCLKVNKVKYEKKVLDTLTQLELEKIRSILKNKREKAIIETLYSTGCRVSELCNINLKDIDFNNKEVIIFGKGNKERITFLNARAEIAIKDYLKDRKDVKDNDPLFISQKAPFSRLKKEAIEKILRNISIFSGINKHITCHTFRRTMATHAIQNGMPIEEVSQLLGHEDISTTMIYAHVKLDKTKYDYSKCII